MVNIYEVCDNCGKPTPDNEMNHIHGSPRLGIDPIHVCAACFPSMNNVDALKKFRTSSKKDVSGETINLDKSNNITPDDSKQKQQKKK